MIETKINHINFSRKPIPIPAEYRPTYKVAQIVLILRLSCSGNKASLLKLHLLSWSLKSHQNRTKLLNYIHSNYEGELKTWGIEPALNRALTYSVAERLCEIEKGKYLLTEKGNNFYNSINDRNDVLHTEQEFLKLLGKRKVTDSRIIALSEKWKMAND